MSDKQRSGLLVDQEGRAWIPAEAIELQLAAYAGRPSEGRRATGTCIPQSQQADKGASGATAEVDGEEIAEDIYLPGAVICLEPGVDRSNDSLYYYSYLTGMYKIDML